MPNIPITEARNGQYVSSDHTDFDCEINHPEYGWLPYSVTSDDLDETIDNEAVRTLLGSSIASYVAPTAEEVATESANAIRLERDTRLLQEVDPLVGNPLRWNELTSEKQTEWTDYRQALLNVPQQETFPNSVTWPVKPD